MTDKENKRLALKQEMELAYLRFCAQYKKVSKGITRLYTEAMLTDDSKRVEELHRRFFGYMMKSKNAKEKWSEDFGDSL